VTRDEIITKIKEHEAAIRAEGVSHLAIFGSRARGDHRPDSDLDVLIEIEPDLKKFSLLDLSGVGLLLQDMTGLQTQIVMKRSIPERFAANIAGDIVLVF
jgi:hypothetical protein